MPKHGREDKKEKKKNKKVESEDEASDPESEVEESAKKPRPASYVASSAKPRTDFEAMCQDLRVSVTDWREIRTASTLPPGLTHILDIRHYDPADPTNPSKNRVGVRNFRFVKGMTDDNPPKPTISTTYDLVDNNTGRKLRITCGPLLGRVRIGPLGDLDDRYSPYAGGDITALDSKLLLKKTNYSILFRGIAPGQTFMPRHGDEKVSAVDARGREKGWEEVSVALNQLSRHIARLVLCYTQTPTDGSKNEFAYPATDTVIQLASGGAHGATYATMTPEQREKAVDLLLASKTSKIHYPNPAGLDKPKIVVPKTHGICSPVCTPLEKDASGKPNYKGVHSGEDYTDKGAVMLGIHGKVAWPYKADEARSEAAIPDNSWESEQVRKYLARLDVRYSPLDVVIMVYNPEKGGYTAVPCKVPLSFLEWARVEVPFSIYPSLDAKLEDGFLALKPQIDGRIVIWGLPEVKPVVGMKTVGDDETY